MISSHELALDKVAQNIRHWLARRMYRILVTLASRAFEVVASYFKTSITFVSITAKPWKRLFKETHLQTLEETFLLDPPPEGSRFLEMRKKR